jgi:hypothetical protein
MRRSRIERIREQIRLRRYDMTFHAMEEMAEDGMTIGDIEHAVLMGGWSKLKRAIPRETGTWSKEWPPTIRRWWA